MKSPNFTVSAIFADDTTEEIMQSDYPAIIGDALMNWTQRIRFRGNLLEIRVDHHISGRAAVIALNSTSRAKQIQIIDELLGWCRNLAYPESRPATDHHSLIYRK